MSLHPNTLFWFQANQTLLSLLKAVYLTEKQQSLWFDQFRLKAALYHTWGKDDNYNNTDAAYQRHTATTPVARSPHEFGRGYPEKTIDLS